MTRDCTEMEVYIHVILNGKSGKYKNKPQRTCGTLRRIRFERFFQWKLLGT